MGRGLDRMFVAKVGAVAFAWALAVPMVLTGAPARSVSVAGAVTHQVNPPVLIASTPATSSLTFATSSFIALHEPDPTTLEIAELKQARIRGLALARTARASVASVPESRPAAPAPARKAEPPPEALIRDGVVIASWYGPRFYGRRTACGQTYTPEILGVAHRVLRCGTLIRITSPKGITVTVPVIDRGPYIAGRALDLSSATRLALACSDLCRVRMTVLE